MKKEIDAYIIPLVDFLNDHGFRTKYSCSGLDIDHDEIKRVPYDGSMNGFGYISFGRLKREKRELIYNIAHESGFTCCFFDNKYLVIYSLPPKRISKKKINDELFMKRWDLLFLKLKEQIE